MSAIDPSLGVDKNRMADKVRKCLALSKSSNEHEAAAALRQAQKMMKKYDLTEEDVGLTAYGAHEVIVRDYEFGRKKPVVLQAVISLSMRAFGVQAMWGAHITPQRLFHKVTYCGPKNRAMLAAYTHEVVYRAVGRAWKQHVKDHPWHAKERGARAGFYVGWCSAVSDKVEAIGTPTEKEETRRFMERHNGGKLTEAKASKEMNMRTANAGLEAGRDFSIHRPVTG